MGVFRWLWQHLDVLLLVAVLIAIGVGGIWAFGLMGDPDSETPRRIKPPRDDDRLD